MQYRLSRAPKKRPTATELALFRRFQRRTLREVCPPGDEPFCQLIIIVFIGVPTAQDPQTCRCTRGNKQATLVSDITRSYYCPKCVYYSFTSNSLPHPFGAALALADKPFAALVDTLVAMSTIRCKGLTLMAPTKRYASRT